MARSGLLLALGAAAMLCNTTGAAYAHCDTLDGPVVTAARQSLSSGDLVPLLRWVAPAAEEEVRAAFARTRAVRALSAEAAELADRWFFETVVRLHREGEGVGYSGLAPAGTPVDPAIAAVDAALASGAVDPVARELGAAAETAVRERFARVLAAQAHADESVERGRELVAAYVELTHFAEALGALAHGAPEHGGHEPARTVHPEPHGGAHPAADRMPPLE
jgi:hypothetical protein